MVQTSNKTPRSLAVLALPKRISAVIAYATGVVQGMTGNPTFPTPVVPLAMVAAAIDDLRNAVTGRCPEGATRRGRRPSPSR